MSDSDVKIIAGRLSLIPLGLTGLYFYSNVSAPSSIVCVTLIFYGFFSAVLQVVAIRTRPAPKATDEQAGDMPPVTVTKQPSPPPTGALLRAESVVRYTSPAQRIAETDAEAGRVRVDPDQYKIMVAIREGKIPRNAISERRIADALGMNRFGGEVKELVRNLAAKGKIEKRGQVWAWVD